MYIDDRSILLSITYPEQVFVFPLLIVIGIQTCGLVHRLVMLTLITQFFSCIRKKHQYSHFYLPVVSF